MNISIIIKMKHGRIPCNVPSRDMKNLLADIDKENHTVIMTTETDYELEKAHIIFSDENEILELLGNDNGPKISSPNEDEIMELVEKDEKIFVDVEDIEVYNQLLPKADCIIIIYVQSTPSDISTQGLPRFPTFKNSEFREDRSRNTEINGNIYSTIVYQRRPQERKIPREVGTK